MLKVTHARAQNLIGQGSLGLHIGSMSSCTAGYTAWQLNNNLGEAQACADSHGKEVSHFLDA